MQIGTSSVKIAPIITSIAALTGSPVLVVAIKPTLTKPVTAGIVVVSRALSIVGARIVTFSARIGLTIHPETGIKLRRAIPNVEIAIIQLMAAMVITDTSATPKIAIADMRAIVAGMIGKQAIRIVVMTDTQAMANAGITGRQATPIVGMIGTREIAKDVTGAIHATTTEMIADRIIVPAAAIRQTIGTGVIITAKIAGTAHNTVAISV